ncbi:unnamed protein product [Colletotrichum noveboracense]|uniref:Major facilitator superfamily transporter n=1 Tax=Colletotrichum noveboracense TaxID=2664923 RepID=A0A9W4RS99_9PEZI|nr:unnamed protein product [Colletotrichum noveboracense]
MTSNIKSNDAPNTVDQSNATLDPVETVSEDDAYAVRIIQIPDSKWKRHYRSVAFQMVLLSLLSFSGPSMSNGPLVSTLGIPIACIIGAIGFPLSGSGFYVNSKYRIQWYLIFAKAIYGITSAFLYVAEASSMISYPEQHRRGFYISIWVIMRNLGSIIAGAISFGLNIARDGQGGVSANTYLAFLGMECIGLPAAFLLTKTRNVIRSDGWGVPLLPKKTWKQECKLLLAHHFHKRTLLLIPVYILTYFGDGVWGTYLSLHFSVRARALSAMLGPLVAVVMNPLFGMILDMKSVGPRRKGIIAYWVWTIPTLGMLVWVMEVVRQPAEGSSFGLTLVYWVLGQFASDVSTNARTGGVFRSWETVGQAISYGINSHVASQFIPFGIYFGIFVVAMPFFYMVLLEVPVEDRVLNITTDDDLIVTNAVKLQDAAIEEADPPNQDAK